MIITENWKLFNEFCLCSKTKSKSSLSLKTLSLYQTLLYMYSPAQISFTLFIFGIMAFGTLSCFITYKITLNHGNDHLHKLPFFILSLNDKINLQLLNCKTDFETWQIITSIPIHFSDNMAVYKHLILCTKQT